MLDNHVWTLKEGSKSSFYDNRYDQTEEKKSDLLTILKRESNHEDYFNFDDDSEKSGDIDCFYNWD